MPRYTCVTNENQFFHSGAKRFQDRSARPPDLPHKGLRWLPVVTTDPSHDPNTQVKTGPVYTIQSDQVTEVWTVRNKTSRELDDEVNARVDSLISDDLANVLTATLNEERKNRNPAAAELTLSQFKAFAKTVLTG